MAEPSTDAGHGGRVSPEERRATFKVRFHELDPNGHLNHGVYLNLFETARIEVMSRLGLELTDLHEQGVHLVVAEARVRFKRPARAGDVLHVECAISELGRVSSWWRQRMTRADGTLLAEADVRSGAVDANGRPTRPPPSLRATLERLQP